MRRAQRAVRRRAQKKQNALAAYELRLPAEAHTAPAHCAAELFEHDALRVEVAFQKAVRAHFDVGIDEIVIIIPGAKNRMNGASDDHPGVEN